MTTLITKSREAKTLRRAFKTTVFSIALFGVVKPAEAIDMNDVGAALQIVSTLSNIVNDQKNDSGYNDADLCDQERIDRLEALDNNHQLSEAELPGEVKYIMRSYKDCVAKAATQPLSSRRDSFNHRATGYAASTASTLNRMIAPRSQPDTGVSFNVQLKF